MWPDNETDVDLLGFGIHADLIRSVVTDEGLLPITVGVFGDWGSGKSSVMKMLKRDLGACDNVACIYFNGWQFEGYDDAKSALVHSILLEIAEHEKLLPTARKKAKSLIRRVDWLRLASVGYQTIVAPIVASQIAAVLGAPPNVAVPAVWPAAPQQSGDIAPDKEDLAKVDLTELIRENPANKGLVGARQLRCDFEELIGDTNLTSFVILIDDLDRCEPSRLVETLEAIKLFLAVPHVAFIIGADERIVRHAIAKRYETKRVEAEEGIGAERIDLVTDYLEKLVQIPYHLPRLSPSEIETYMTLLFCKLRLKEGFEQIHKVFVETRKEDVTSTFGFPEVKAILQASPSYPKELDEELAWCQSIALPLSDILKGNPRQTKRLLNSLLLRRKLADTAHLELSDPVLVKLMLLEYLRPRLFAQLYQWQAAQQGMPKEMRALEHDAAGEDEELVKIANELLEREPGWADSSMTIWLQMTPALADCDLRDYFWITRDRITGILAGVSTIPSHLRGLISELLEVSEGIILPETMSQVVVLSTDEQNVLFQELSQMLLRDPTSHDLIATWLELGEMVPQGFTRLLGTLERLSPSVLDGSTPMKLANLAQTRPKLRERTIALLELWSQENRTVAGRSAQEALSDLRQGGV